MPFEKNKSGNPAGRPKGSKNKIDQRLKKKITAFLVDEFDQIKYDFSTSMRPTTRAKVYVDLLKYVIPTQSNTTNKVNFEKLTEAELDTIIDELKKSQSNE